MKKLVISVAVIIAAAVAAAAIVGISFKLQLGALSRFEESVVEQYDLKGKLNNDNINAALDSVEDYVSKNKIKLGIVRYTRYDDSIEVRFLIGVTHIFTPRMYSVY